MRKAVITLLFLIISFEVNAQFGNLFNQQGQGTTQQRDTSVAAAETFSIKDYFRALSHKDTMNVAPMFIGSIVLPGSAQFYNKDYWKMPIIYTGLGTLIYTGYRNNLKFHKTGEEKYKNYRNYLYAGAATLYWASLMDGVVSFKAEKNPDPGKAALYSALLPGLGQAYIGDYWRIPIYYTGFIACGYFWDYNNQQYKRYKNLMSQYPNNSDYKYFRDSFRRYRDYSILATVIVYALNIIDANVFALMSDFDMSDDLSLNISPAVIQPQSNFAYNFDNYSGLGLRMSLTF